MGSFVSTSLGASIPFSGLTSLLGFHKVHHGWCTCLTLCDLMDCSLPVSSGPWGFSRPEYWSGFPCPPPGDLSNPGIKPRSPTLQEDSLLAEPQGKPDQLEAAQWTAACQAPLSMGFSLQENCRGWLCSPPEDLSDTEIKPTSPALLVDSYLWATR